MADNTQVRIRFGPMAKAFMREPEALVQRGQREAIKAAGPFVQRNLVFNTPVGATGKARQMVMFEEGFTAGEGHVGYGAPASEYIGHANAGTRPHTPPWGPIRYWALRKGLNPGKVWWGIRKRGTRAQKFIQKTATESQDPAVRLMRDAFMRVLRQREV